MNLSNLMGISPEMFTVQVCCAKYNHEFTDEMRDRIEKYRSQNKAFFVFVDRIGIDTLIMHERSHNLGNIVGSRLKRGVVIWFHDNSMREVNWDNWKETYAMITPKAQYVRDDRPNRYEIQAHKERKRLDKFVKEGMPDQAQGKFGKRGHSTVSRGLMIPTKRKYSWFDTGAQARQKSSEVKVMHSKIYQVDMSLV